MIVCCENFLIYRDVDHPEVRAVIPRRSKLSPDRGVLITASTTFKQKGVIYIFVQVGVAGWVAGWLGGGLEVWSWMWGCRGKLACTC